MCGRVRACAGVCACVVDSEAGNETHLSLFSSTFDSVLVCAPRNKSRIKHDIVWLDSWDFLTS